MFVRGQDYTFSIGKKAQEAKVGTMEGGKSCHKLGQLN